MHAQTQAVPLHKLAVDEGVTYHHKVLRWNTPQSIFDDVAAAFNQEAHLLPVTGEELRHSFDEGLAVLALSNLGRTVIGFTRLSRLTGDDDELGGWYELGSTWVHPEYRGQGINRSMYELFLACNSGKNILATTTNCRSYALGQSLGLVDVKRSELPKRLWLASCTCPSSKMGDANPEKCQHARGEPHAKGNPCYFRITPETAKRLAKAA